MFCRIDARPPSQRSHQYQQWFEALNLNPQSPSWVFQAALEQAVQYLNSQSTSPKHRLAAWCAWCDFAETPRISLSPTLNLEQLHHAQVLRSQGVAYTHSYAQYILDSQQPLAIPDTTQDIVFATSPLYQHHGIKSYCGVPLMTQEEICLGVMAVAARSPRAWTEQDIALIQLLARWCITTQERDSALQRQATETPAQPSLQLNIASTTDIQTISAPQSIYEPLMVRFLQELTQELRIPLTSIMGMTRVLEQKVYGVLTDKQQEYLRIVRQSGEQLLTTAEEIVKLGHLLNQKRPLEPSTTDVEMFVQQVLQQLDNFRIQHHHSFHLSLEPGHRLWLLDRAKLAPAIYQLLRVILTNLHEGSELHIHISWKAEADSLQPQRLPDLHMAIWAAHPQLTNYGTNHEFDPSSLKSQIPPPLQQWVEQYPIVLTLLGALRTQLPNQLPVLNIREVCSLLLCCELIESHQGRLSLKASSQTGYCYMIKLHSWEPNGVADPS